MTSPVVSSHPREDSAVCGPSGGFIPSQGGLCRLWALVPQVDPLLDESSRLSMTHLSVLE